MSFLDFLMRKTTPDMRRNFVKWGSLALGVLFLYLGFFSARDYNLVFAVPILKIPFLTWGFISGIFLLLVFYYTKERGRI